MVKQGSLNGEDLDGDLVSNFENAETYLKSLFNSRRNDKAILFDDCVKQFKGKFGIIITAQYLKTLIGEGTKHSSMKMNYQLAQTNYVTQREPNENDNPRIDGSVTWTNGNRHIDKVIPLNEFLGRIETLKGRVDQLNQEIRSKEESKDWAVGLLNFFDITDAEITPNLFAENGVIEPQHKKVDQGEINKQVAITKTITKDYPETMCGICKHKDKIDPALGIVMELEEPGSSKKHICLKCKVKEEKAQANRPAFEVAREDHEIWAKTAGEFYKQFTALGFEAPRLEESLGLSHKKNEKRWQEEPQKLWFMDTCDSFVE